MRSEEFIRENYVGQASPVGSTVSKKKKPKIDVKKNVEEIAKQIKSVK